MREVDKFEDDVRRIVRLTNDLTGKFSALIQDNRKKEISIKHRDETIDILKRKLLRLSSHSNKDVDSNRSDNVINSIIDAMEDPKFELINNGIVFNRGIREYCSDHPDLSTDEFKMSLMAMGYDNARSPTRYKGKPERYWSKGGLSIKDINNGL